MKKKHKKSKLEHIQGLDNIFSEIDVKENTIINTNNDNFKLYSLDILSDNSIESDDSIDLNDYDLETETEQQPIISVSNNTITVNTEDFFNCLLDIENNNDQKLVEKKKKEKEEEQEKNDNFKIQYINDMSDLMNIIPEKLIVKKENHTESKSNQNKSEIKQSQNNQTSENNQTLQNNQNLTDSNNIIVEKEVTPINISTNDNQKESSKNENIKNLTITNDDNKNLTVNDDTNLNNNQNLDLNLLVNNQKIQQLNNEINSDTILKKSDTIIESKKETESKKEIESKKEDLKDKDIKDITTSQKNDIWGDLKTNIMTSYNYLCSESAVNDFLIDSIKLKDFYNNAKSNQKNDKGYIENNNIIQCSNNIDYPYEVYTKIGDSKIIDPPGNYINIFLIKNLDIVKRLYILCNSGYWILEPLENYRKLLQNNNTKNILKIYFIIIKLLYCNKHYPFDTGDCIKKYKNLIKNINLNLIINYINNQLTSVFNISQSIDDLIDIFKKNNINKYYTNILKLKYINY